MQGIRGFYKGITASYMGISETVIHFVIYEAVKAKLIEHRHSISHSNVDSRSSKDFLEFMMAGAISKTVASCIAYPHGECLLKQLTFVLEKGTLIVLIYYRGCKNSA